MHIAHNSVRNYYMWMYFISTCDVCMNLTYHRVNKISTIDVSHEAKKIFSKKENVFHCKTLLKIFITIILIHKRNELNPAWYLKGYISAHSEIKYAFKSSNWCDFSEINELMIIIFSRISKKLECLHRTWKK